MDFLVRVTNVPNTVVRQGTLLAVKDGMSSESGGDITSTFTKSLSSYQDIPATKQMEIEDMSFESTIDPPGHGLCALVRLDGQWCRASGVGLGQAVTVSTQKKAHLPDYRVTVQAATGSTLFYVNYTVSIDLLFPTKAALVKLTGFMAEDVRTLTMESCDRLRQMLIGFEESVSDTCACVRAGAEPACEFKVQERSSIGKESSDTVSDQDMLSHHDDDERDLGLGDE